MMKNTFPANGVTILLMTLPGGSSSICALIDNNVFVLWSIFSQVARLFLGFPHNNYYEFIINEGSYIFWAVFQLATVAILLYSTFAAIYFARYTYFNEKIPADYDEPFITRHMTGRSAFSGFEPGIYQNIMDAVDRSYDFEDDDS
ncbi:uncharacterized protein LOC113467735 [Diaphorina citri]|uniref:Uncharacterized protein LOC113467735 n=1 Tax=Diaphorina citri TaxID=121845 RepID=A0A3Q0IUH1_DIACI|nr:uncharacterized protein LOC113467735 [Diaphorina citri]